MDALFVDGVPAKVTVHDFRRHHLCSFPQLLEAEYDALISGAIDTVYTMFPGVARAWDMHRDKQVWFDKTQLCYRLLTAWLLSDQYPELASGIAAVGGAGWLKRKKADGVDLWFNTDMLRGSSPMEWLKTNDFGRKAWMMLQTAPKRALLRVERFV